MSSALDEYCGSTFWNDSYLDRPDPDLPVCLEQTVLVWIPLGFFWVCAPWQLPPLFNSKQRGVRNSKLYLVKQALACSLLLTSAIGLIITLLEDYSDYRDPTPETLNPLVLYVNPSIYTATWLMVLLVHESGKRANDKNSPYLFIFWLLSILCGVFTLQTLIRLAIREGSPPDLPRFSLFCISYCLQWISFIVSCISDISSEVKAAAKKNPQLSASFLSEITFHWFSSMMLKGYRKPLEAKHLWELNDVDKPQTIYTKFERHMMQGLKEAQRKMEGKRNKEIHKETEQMNGFSRSTSQDILVMEEKTRKDKKKKPEKLKTTPTVPVGWLVLSMLKNYRHILIKGVIFKLLHDTLMFVNPQLLKLMVSFTEDMSVYQWMGYLYAVLLFIVALFQSLLLQQYFQCCFLLGMRVRTAIIAAVYKKALTISNTARKESTMGEIVNLMAVDAQRFNDVTNFIHLLWSAPLQILVGVVFLWQELGPSVLAGLAIMILLIPINGVLMSKIKNLQMSNMKHKDQRMKLMNEILNGIKVMKFYAWEPSFAEQIFGIREKELKVMKKSLYLLAVAIFVVTCTPFMVTLTSFGVYLTVDPKNILDAEKAFTSISLFNILRFPLMMLPMVISSMVQAAVSCKRLEAFLGSENLNTSAIQQDPSCGTLDSAITFTEATFSWNRNETPTVKNVTLNIKPGKLVAVVGPVGSGKTSLISALLGEMENIKGFINIKGSFAYVPQQAWIQNNTLQDNILFGLEWEESRYQKVLEACALLPDLELLPAGDQTEIGEKGINLSGGQKQRVSLARAVYSDSDIIVLDDPLSAVDAHVGKHIFEKVIGPNGLLKNKTRILVTHGVTFLPQTDEIVVLVNGEVSEVGSYKTLRANMGAFADFLNTYGEGSHSEEGEPTVNVVTEEDLTPGDDQVSQVDVDPGEAITLSLKRENSERARSRKWSKNSIRVSLKKAKMDKDLVSQKEGQVEMVKGQKLIEKETMETGKVKFSIYWKYLRAIGWWYSLLIILSYITQNVATIGQNLWLSDWTNDASHYINTTYPASERDQRLGIFGVLGVAQAVFVLLGVFLMAGGTIVASRDLHSRLLQNILHVPMLFFDTTPTGRIINRFSKDIYTIDETIPMSFRSWLSCFFGVLGTLAVICLATPYFTIVIVPLVVIYYFIQIFYVVTSRQLRRLDSVTRSPIYSHFSETILGLPVIRAYRHQARFLADNEKIINENQKCVFAWIVSNRWLAIRLEFLGNFVVFFAALFAVISRGSLDSGLVGLSISYALNVTQALNWLVRQTSELETNIVAVERVSEYTELDNEAPWTTDHQPEKSWPNKGEIKFLDYKVRYRPELDLVLHGITCEIQPNEKVGIVGRTGAGKSSLANCLFRILESAGGKILIDGVDISTIGLHDLRQKLSIIPQDPVLFSGTIHMNLDPFSRHTDEEMWRSLELAHLKQYVANLPDKLQHEVSEGGENLSVGQRQLLCLARALLRKSKILVLDEATAAIDLETDDLIQTTIRKEFTDCTVLTIAHRLHTIMDCTRVMVLDAGRIIEFDSPFKLLQKQGYFYNMAKDAGITEAGATAL
ncbi:canalicular multispecific organic anion transporter 1 isoform X1 [Chiloscyllium plagiosum]|uniref:canalicular multispecific organic anion transporter 1 isoform X1 n=1 Tax=Chiloscyllium plagiosum TaxID=36176 RepID=UPI001CB812A0|nr:canalicular multispecific organic anion transporter 1 isoform X1 [Chiloscyllium plagiosum]